MLSIRRAVAGAILAGAIAVPSVALAQQAPQTNTQTGQHDRRAGGFMHRLDDLNLSDQQKAQIQQLVQNFRQAHPQGSPRDPQAMKQLRDQIEAVLTPDQRAKLQEQAQYRGQNGEQRLADRNERGNGFFQQELQKLNLTPQQQQQIQQLQADYEKAHPEGSAPDRQAHRQLREQMMNVLTPAQRTQFQNDMQQWRSQHPRPNPNATP